MEAHLHTRSTSRTPSIPSPSHTVHTHTPPSGHVMSVTTGSQVLPAGGCSDTIPLILVSGIVVAVGVVNDTSNMLVKIPLSLPLSLSLSLSLPPPSLSPPFSLCECMCA